MVGPVVPQVQDQIYEEVVDQGWFSARPDVVRAKWVGWVPSRWSRRWWPTGLLVALTRFGLLGLVLVGLAVGVLWVSQQMPRRTSPGFRGAQGSPGAGYEPGHPADHPRPKDDAYAEISRIIPYAIVLGSFDRWLQAWWWTPTTTPACPIRTIWVGRAPATWQLSDLPSSIDAFITTVEGKLYSRH